MKKVAIILILLTLLFSLSGCGNAITEGEVYGKEYREEFNTVTLLPIVISNGKTSTTTFVPYFIHYPERYVVFIKAYKDEEWKTEDFYVTQEVYDSINIGDMFLYDKDRGDLQEEPYTKRREQQQ